MHTQCIMYYFLSSFTQHSPPSNSQSTSDFVTLVPVNEQHSSPQACPPQLIATVVPSIHAGPVLVKVSFLKQFLVWPEVLLKSS